jgi:hypothetical protein
LRALQIETNSLGESALAKNSRIAKALETELFRITRPKSLSIKNHVSRFFEIEAGPEILVHYSKQRFKSNKSIAKKSMYVNRYVFQALSGSFRKMDPGSRCPCASGTGTGTGKRDLLMTASPAFAGAVGLVEQTF